MTSRVGRLPPPLSVLDATSHDGPRERRARRSRLSGGGVLRAIAIAVAVALASFAAGLGAAQDAARTLSPRLMLTPDVVARIQSEAKRDAQVERNIRRLLEEADGLLAKPTLVETFKATYGGVASHLPHIGHISVPRLMALPLAWHLSGDRRYADKAREELLGLVGLETWYPEHFLGLSRMALGVTLGYDWLGDYLSAEERRLIRTALIEKALEPALGIFKDDKERYAHDWISPVRRGAFATPVEITPGLPGGTGAADLSWPISAFNWNLACNTGLTLAALAVQPEAGEIAKRVIGHTIPSVRSGFDEFAPDGAWPEGPMYWALAARDAAILVDALETATGDSLELPRSLGLSDTGRYILHATGPTGMMFNYGDSDTHVDRTSMNWLAARYQRPVYAWFAQQGAGDSEVALDLIWQRTPGLEPSQTLEPRAAWFGGYNLVMMRSGWRNPDALYAGMKAGSSRSHHDDLDLGTFILDALGVRWAVDLGPGNYALPGYFAGDRFQYYRTATIGQNTLTFDGRNQTDLVRSDIIDFSNAPELTYAIADLSAAYDAPRKSVLRGMALIGRTYLAVHDEISANRPEPVLWTMHTRAAVDNDGGTAVLRQNDRQLAATILLPKGARFETLSANPCETKFNAHCAQQNPNTGVKRLVVRVPAGGPDETRRIIVIFVPGASGPPDPLPGSLPLAQWRQTQSFGLPLPRLLGGGTTD